MKERYAETLQTGKRLQVFEWFWCKSLMLKRKKFVNKRKFFFLYSDGTGWKDWQEFRRTTTKTEANDLFYWMEKSPHREAISKILVVSESEIRDVRAIRRSERKNKDKE